MKLYNTDTRSIEEFKPQKTGRVKYYSCGPTVYDKPTIGNWASFIRYDILARALKTEGQEIEWIMNITDVGHLVSDGDEGEDKLEKGARRESKTAWEVAKFYSEYFIQGLEYFNISIPKKNILKATDYIKQQIDMVKTLEAKGHTYAIDDGVYFDSTTFADYGKMARLDLAGQKSGVRVDVGGKKHPTDFALWKFSPKDKKRDMEWDSPWGKGFPGWHLECSAIILAALGESIDIHAGGIEHIPVHHTNEIAQSESANEKKLSSFWVHNNHLKVDGEKISKSLNNGFIIEDLKQKGFSGLDFRMFVLSSNYRNEANFTWEALTEARSRRIELQAAADLRYQDSNQDDQGKLSEVKNNINDALDDNIDTSAITSQLSVFCNGLSDGLIYEKEEFTEFLKWLDELLGLDLIESKDISDEQKNLISQRNNYRAEKNWTEADKLREELLKQGVGLKDTADSSVWFRTA